MAKKWLKKITPNPKKFTPQFVKKSETLTKLSQANIAQHIVQTQSAVAKADSLAPKDIRPILREQHELLTTPFSKTSAMILERNNLPHDDPERARLTAQINAKTLNRGKLGIAVAGTVVGGVAGTAISKGGDILTRVNPGPGDGLGQADTLPNYWPDVQDQMYSRYPIGAPAAQVRTPNRGAPQGGIVSSIVGALWKILVPPARREGTAEPRFFGRPVPASLEEPRMTIMPVPISQKEPIFTTMPISQRPNDWISTGAREITYADGSKRRVY